MLAAQMIASVIPIAHAGHWIANLALFAGPVLVPLAALVAHTIHVRRNQTPGHDSFPSRRHR